MQSDNDHGTSEHVGSEKPGKGPKSFHYIVDGTQYETSASVLTGAQIKASIANFDPAYQLVLEGRGNDADSVISDSETVSLGPPPPQLYTAPPANFG